MSIGFITSFGLLWIIVIILSFLVFALARQVGILHERVAPAGALLPTSGPKVGEMTEAMNVNDLDGKRITIGGIDSTDLATLIMFISPAYAQGGGGGFENHQFQQGGGFQQGLVHGSSDRIGGFPNTDPLVPGDIISTMFRCLGIAHNGEIHDQLDRPYRVVPTGDVVPALLA